MKKVFQMCKSIWIAHLSAVVVVLLCYIMLSAVVKNKTVLLFMGTLVYVTLIFGAGQECGRKDARKIGDSFPDFKKAVIAVLMTSIVSVVLLSFRIIAYHTYPTVWRPSGVNYEMIETASPFLLTTDVIYKLYHCFFMPIFLGGELMAYVLPIFVPIIVFPSGYLLGIRKSDFLDKHIPSLIYKKEKQKD